jgi:hypothetical protein
LLNDWHFFSKHVIHFVPFISYTDKTKPNLSPLALKLSRLKPLTWSYSILVFPKPFSKYPSTFDQPSQPSIDQEAFFNIGKKFQFLFSELRGFPPLPS